MRDTSFYDLLDFPWDSVTNENWACNPTFTPLMWPYSGTQIINRAINPISMCCYEFIPMNLQVK